VTALDELVSAGEVPRLYGPASTVGLVALVAGFGVRR
jgi:hypothetical protein